MRYDSGLIEARNRMVKAKSPGAHAVSTLPKALDSQLAKALGLVEAKKYGEAAELFESLVESAKESGNLGLQRTVRNYLSVCHEHTSKTSKGHPSPDAEAQWLLNQGNSKAALTVLDKALKAAPNHAALHYLKASAHAQAGEAEASAEALNRALLLDGDLLNLYRLEPDFENVRNQAPFASIERA